MNYLIFSERIEQYTVHPELGQLIDKTKMPLPLWEITTLTDDVMLRKIPKAREFSSQYTAMSVCGDGKLMAKDKGIIIFLYGEKVHQKQLVVWDIFYNTSG